LFVISFISLSYPKTQKKQAPNSNPNHKNQRKQVPNKSPKTQKYFGFKKKKKYIH